MFKLGFSLIFLSVLIDEDGGVKLMFSPQVSLIISAVIFTIGIIFLYRVKNSDEESVNEIKYSDEYKSKLLIKYMYFWLAIALLLDITIALLLENQFWSHINPFDSNIVFLVLLFISIFSGFLKVKVLPTQNKLICSRLGFITSNISGIKDLIINEKELVIISQDNGRFTFRLNRFSKPVSDYLAYICSNMPNKPIKRD